MQIGQTVYDTLKKHNSILANAVDMEHKVVKVMQNKWTIREIADTSLQEEYEIRLAMGILGKPIAEPVVYAVKDEIERTARLAVAKANILYTVPGDVAYWLRELEDSSYEYYWARKGNFISMTLRNCEVRYNASLHEEWAKAVRSMQKRHFHNVFPGAICLEPPATRYEGAMLRVYQNGELDMQVSPGVWMDMDPETVKRMAVNMSDLPFSNEVLVMINTGIL